MKKIGVILAGSGVYDGSEIHESTAVLLAIDKAGATYQCIAPNKNQMHAINHLTGQEIGENRNVLEESARIARGEILDIVSVSADDFDALIFPGGFGAAKNLSTFAVDGANASVDGNVLQLTREMHKKGKPIGAICIAPATLAKIFDGSRTQIEVTIGADKSTATEIEKTGAKHVEKSVFETHIDIENKIVTTPAYMLAERISEVFAGIEQLVNDVLDLC
ncbi:MAG: isoprenoid biosynthesis glyoxalase ElbB [Candidatus Marinimicrobia bacterium]|nr:isoprenoid biosynthesis glyoxalase ElbB [Candidatus Neomarinimicrobiota bacterium]